MVYEGLASITMGIFYEITWIEFFLRLIKVSIFGVLGSLKHQNIKKLFVEETQLLKLVISSNQVWLPRAGVNQNETHVKTWSNYCTKLLE